MNKTAIIDVEASGLHFDSYPIEVAVLVRGKLHSWLIRPAPHWQYWCTTAEGLHGITRETLDKNGLPITEVVENLDKLLSDFEGALYSDAYQWDSDWIDTLYFAAHKRRGFHITSIFDLLEPEKVKVFEQEKSILAASGQYQCHRAEDDVLLISEAFHRSL